MVCSSCFPQSPADGGPDDTAGCNPTVGPWLRFPILKCIISLGNNVKRSIIGLCPRVLRFSSPSLWWKRRYKYPSQKILSFHFGATWEQTNYNRLLAYGVKSQNQRCGLELRAGQEPDLFHTFLNTIQIVKVLQLDCDCFSVFVTSLRRNTCGIIMLSNQHLNLPPVRWMDFVDGSAHEHRFRQLGTIFERNRPFV